MAGDFIPDSDVNFDLWLTNFQAKLAADPAAYGLVAGDVTPLTNARTNWVGEYATHLDAIAAASSARVIKDGARASVTVLARALARRMQSSGELTDGERALLGITVPGSDPAPSGPPTTWPVGMAHCDRLRHILSWMDSETHKKAKPRGVLGAEIHVAIVPVGTATPTDPAAFTFIALDTNSPYIMEFDAADAGKNAHYLLRWVRADHQKGPWSETVSCTITA